jgi:hypothetical protein
MLTCVLQFHLHCVSPQFKVSDKSALVVYPETHEEEWVNLGDLVQEKCIAVGEWGGLGGVGRGGGVCADTGTVM